MISVFLGDDHESVRRGIDVCRDIRSARPEIQCFMLTAYDDDQAIYAAVSAGAAGYVLKDIRGEGQGDSRLDGFEHPRKADHVAQCGRADKPRARAATIAG